MPAFWAVCTQKQRRLAFCAIIRYIKIPTHLSKNTGLHSNPRRTDRPRMCVFGYACISSYLLPWPWSVSDDLDMRPWHSNHNPIEYTNPCLNPNPNPNSNLSYTPTMNFLGQGSFKSYSRDRTDRQTDATERITTPHSRVTEGVYVYRRAMILTVS